VARVLCYLAAMHFHVMLIIDALGLTADCVQRFIKSSFGAPSMCRTLFEVVGRNRLAR
jgi:hypothetical protein